MSGRRRTTLTRHAEACGTCGTVREDVRTIARTASGLATMEPPQGALDRIMEAVRATPTASRAQVAARHMLRAGRVAAIVVPAALLAVGSMRMCAQWARPHMAPRQDPWLASLYASFRNTKAPEPNAVDLYYRVAPSIPRSAYFSWQLHAIGPAEDARALGGREALAPWLRHSTPPAADAALDRGGREALAILRNAFAAKGRAMRQLDYWRGDNVLDRCVALLGAHGREAQRRGDAEEACRSGLDIVRIAQDITRGGGFANAWWGLGAQRVGHRLLGDNILRLDRPAAERTLTRVRDLRRARPTLGDVVVAEGATMPLERSPEFGWPLGLWVRPDQARALQKDRYIMGLISAASDTAAFRRMPELPRGVLPWVDRGWPSTFFGYCDINEARNRCIELALAVRRFRLDHGRLPASLRDLPGDDQTSAVDPLTNVYLIYRKTDASPQGFTVYSIGPDLRDDAGRPAAENETGCPGDIGVRPFAMPSLRSIADNQDYRRVPFMLPPIRRAGWPALPE